MKPKKSEEQILNDALDEKIDKWGFAKDKTDEELTLDLDLLYQELHDKISDEYKSIVSEIVSEIVSLEIELERRCNK
jgi:hypothetical protein